MFAPDLFETLSVQIIDLCQSAEIDHPRELYRFSVGYEPLLYARIHQYCTFFIGLLYLEGEEPKTQKENVLRGLNNLSCVIEAASELYTKEDRETEYFKCLSNAEKMQKLEASKHDETGEPQNMWGVYFLQALVHLVDYKKLVLLSYREEENFIGNEVDPTPYENSINALGSLILAQQCLEFGLANMEKLGEHARASAIREHSTSELENAEKQLEEVTSKLSERTNIEQKIRHQYEKQMVIENQRFEPLKRKNSNINKIKQIAIQAAQREWNEDKEQLVRIGKMAKLIQKRLPDYINATPNLSDIEKSEMLERVPTTTNTINNWIREIAPNYARQKGAPKTP